MSVETGNRRYLRNGNRAKFVKCLYNDLKSRCEFCRSRNIEEPCVKIQAAEYDPSRALQRVCPCKNEKDRMLFEFIYSSESYARLEGEVWLITRLLASYYGTVPASALLRHSICAVAAHWGRGSHLRAQREKHTRLGLALLNPKSPHPNSIYEHFFASILFLEASSVMDSWFIDLRRALIRLHPRSISTPSVDDVPQASIAIAKIFFLRSHFFGSLYRPEICPLFKCTVTVGMYWARESEAWRLRPCQNNCYSIRITATLKAVGNLLGICADTVTICSRRIGEVRNMLEVFLDDPDLQNAMKTFSDTLTNKPVDRDTRGILRIFEGVACLRIFLQLFMAPTLAEGLGVIGETPEAATLLFLRETLNEMDAQSEDGFWRVEICGLILSACVLSEPYDETGMSITFTTLKLSSSKNHPRAVTPLSRASMETEPQATRGQGDVFLGRKIRTHIYPSTVVDWHIRHWVS